MGLRINVYDCQAAISELIIFYGRHMFVVLMFFEYTLAYQTVRWVYGQKND